jgi:hypothetical protein
MTLRSSIIPAFGLAEPLKHLVSDKFAAIEYSFPLRIKVLHSQNLKDCFQSRIEPQGR